MVRTRILLDTNAYIRLARCIHPLLDQEFGSGPTYRLFAIDQLIAELRNSPRLSSKFAWVYQTEYSENRKRKLIVSKRERKEIQLTSDYINEHARGAKIPTSRTDNHAIATAHVLGIRLVTDDRSMRELAKTYNADTMTTLQLVHLMLQTGHIAMETVRQIAAYWQSENDTPGNFASEYVHHFGEAPPSA